MRKLQAVVVAVLMAIVGAARADLGVEGSRLVYTSDESSAAMRVWNRGDRSSLIQAWIDVGDPDAKPEELRPPLMVTPPMFRLPPGSNRDLTVRAVTAQSLPIDRESLLWLNVLDIPARAVASDAATGPEYAVRWRLKVFYRPVSLVGSVESAAASLKWRLVTDQQGAARLLASNDSPFHVSVAELQLGGVALPVPPDRAVIAPFTSWSLDLPSTSARNGELRMLWVDDHGKWQEHLAALMP